MLGVTLLGGGLWACGSGGNDNGGGDPFGHIIPGDNDNTGDSQPPGDNTPQGVEINPGWIGGACADAQDCDDPNMNAAQCLETGFPNGFCTQACDPPGTPPFNSSSWTCPDTDYGGLATRSRCIDANGSPQCAAECDETKSPTGCRPGYICVPRSRYAEPQTVFDICLPADIGRWPGEPEPGFDIGGPCATPGDCEYNACFTWVQDGYCTKSGCNATGCPDGATCMAVQGTTTEYYCFDDCTQSSDCRQSRGYICDADDTCWRYATNPPPPTWDSSQGATDCATYATALHPCDTTPDDYVVVRKAARNIALCNNGALVSNFRVALGSAPLDDKKREGDGRTPEGTYYVAAKLDPSQFHKALLISYPSPADGAEGLANGIIDQPAKDAIDLAGTNCASPDQNTGMGGEVEIHGNNISTRGDWTLGCVAVTDNEVDTIFLALDEDDTIVIVP
jgi:hypothetical protein